MEVLASKTGYDVDMIEDDMELETELGIDSIKRVEILSEVQSRLGVEAKDVAALSRTRTVGEVISAMANEMGGAAPAPARQARSQAINKHYLHLQARDLLPSLTPVQLAAIDLSPNTNSQRGQETHRFFRFLLGVGRPQ